MTTPIEKLKQLAESEHVAKDCYCGYSIGKLTSDEAVMLYMHRKTKEHKGVRNRLLREKRAEHFQKKQTCIQVCLLSFKLREKVVSAL